MKIVLAGKAGTIYYEQMNSSNANRTTFEKAEKDVNAAFPELSTVNLSWLLIVTWIGVPYYNTRFPQNSFQAILSTNEHYSFVIFYYHQIQWTSLF